MKAIFYRKQEESRKLIKRGIRADEICEKKPLSRESLEEKKSKKILKERLEKRKKHGNSGKESLEKEKKLKFPEKKPKKRKKMKKIRKKVNFSEKKVLRGIDREGGMW